MILDAYITFVVEEKILKIGGSKLLSKTQDVIRKKYDCDSLQYYKPSRLKFALGKMPKPIATRVISEISKDLSEFKDNKKISYLLRTICK